MPRSAALYRGIPQDGATLGDPDAPATMVEFVDLQCPFCAEYTRDALPTIVKRYVRTGKLKIELRPVAILGPDSATARGRGRRRGAENRIWQFADLFYLNQGRENSGYVDDDFLRRIARGAGVNPAAGDLGLRDARARFRCCARPRPRPSATASAARRRSCFGARAGSSSRSRSRASSRPSSPPRSTRSWGE